MTKMEINLITLNWLSKSVDRHGATVVCLFFSRSPAAIPRSVGVIVIDAVKLMFGSRAATHVDNEIGVVIPSRIDGDASSAIAMEVFSFGIMAPFAHGGPSFPFWSKVGPFSMFCIGLFDALNTQASARLCGAVFQIVGIKDFFVSAIAGAKKAGVDGGFGERKNSQATKALADNIFGWSHSGVLTTGDSVVN